jgi:hypothetical protein
MSAWPDWALAPLIVPGMKTGVFHSYVVPTGTIVTGALLAGETVNPLPLQVEIVWAGITGLGFTVTVTLNGVLEHNPEVAVTEYVTT